jgi:hypothetical protein
MTKDGDSVISNEERDPSLTEPQDTSQADGDFFTASQDTFRENFFPHRTGGHMELT